MSWKRMMFKGNKVYAEVDESGKPIISKGRVRIKYKESDDRVYEAGAKGVEEIDEERLKKEREEREKEKEKENEKENEKGKEKKDLGRRAGGLRESGAEGTLPAPRRQGPQLKSEIHIFTDGASSGNPGPAGVGVVLKYRQHTRTISKHVGECTNNEAELMAVKEGLLAVKNPALPVRLYVDSEYAQGVLTLGWKARANAELVYEIREIMKGFADLEIRTVRGHAGHGENELADSLAWKGARKRGQATFHSGTGVPPVEKDGQDGHATTSVHGRGG